MSGGEGGGFTPRHDPDNKIPAVILVALGASALLVLAGLLYGLVALVRWVVG